MANSRRLLPGRSHDGRLSRRLWPLVAAVVVLLLVIVAALVAATRLVVSERAAAESRAAAMPGWATQGDHTVARPTARSDTPGRSASHGR